MEPKPLTLTHLVQEPHMPPPEGTKPPLLILLHGVGSNEYDLMGLTPYLDPRFLVLSARGPLTLGPSAFGWYPVQFTPTGPIADESIAETSRERLLRFIPEAVEAYDADPARVYLMGFSQGAIMSLFTALTRPNVVTGIVPMSGRLLNATLEKRASEDALRGLPVFAVHGIYDKVLPISEGRFIRDELSKLPVALTYKEYEMAHEVSSESLRDVAAFLTEQLNTPVTR
jgi:phospholipase/carboxylesterase